jgi:NitT/TauT family transport system substrate-binding protein
MFRRFQRRFAAAVSTAVSTVALATAALFLTVACSSNNPEGQLSAPIAVGTNPWIGYAGQYIGVGKGLFTAQKLNIQDVAFPNVTAELAAFLAKKIDIGCFTSADAVQIAAADPTARIIYTIDYSNGGDGIIARSGANPAALKGKTIAHEDNLSAQIMLRTYLEKGGLKASDVTIVNKTADAAAAAFAAKEVDAAISFEPFLRKAAKDGGGTVVFSSENTNLIADVIVVREALLKSRPSDVQAYLKAFDQAIKLFVTDDPESLKIVGTKLGASEAEIKDQKALVKLFDIAGNKETAFNPSSPQSLSGNLELTAKAALDFRITEKPIDPKILVNETLVRAL